MDNLTSPKKSNFQSPNLAHQKIRLENKNKDLNDEIIAGKELMIEFYKDVFLTQFVTPKESANSEAELEDLKMLKIAPLFNAIKANFYNMKEKYNSLKLLSDVTFSNQERYSNLSVNKPIEVEIIERETQTKMEELKKNLEKETEVF